MIPLELGGKVKWTGKGRNDGIEEMVTRTHESQPFPDGRHPMPGIAPKVSHSPRGEHQYSHLQRKTMRNKDIRCETGTVCAQGWGPNVNLLESCTPLLPIKIISVFPATVKRLSIGVLTGVPHSLLRKCDNSPYITQALPMILLLKNKIKTYSVLDWDTHRVPG